MSPDCRWCEQGQEPDEYFNHHSYGEGFHLSAACTRGPIELELRRAAGDSHFFDDGASSLTWAVFFSARAFHGLGEEDYADVYSYAIEAAAALGL